MNMFKATCAALLIAAAAPLAAQGAQPRELTVAAGQPFAHANSGITVPATLGGLARINAREYEAPQLDVSLEFATPDRGEDISVYIYRTTAGSIPVWFDRAVWAVEARPNFGKLTRASTGAFTPPRQTNASGLAASWSIAEFEYKSTAVALAPLGQWIVKLRYSSRTLDPAALDARVQAVMAQLQWPSTIAPAPAAALIADCTTPLKLAGRSRPAKQDGATAMLGALLGGMAGSGKATQAAPVTWCRDATRLPVGGVYRANGAVDGYLLALSDAGRAIWVQPSAAAQLMAKGKPAAANWTVDLYLPGRTINFAPQDRLPAPAQALEMLSTQPVSQMTTWGDKPQMTLGTGTLDK